IADRVREVGVIRQIEEFESQFDSMPLVNLEDSSHRGIERNPCGADKGIVPSVSESAGGICDEGGRTEPDKSDFVANVGIPDYVRPVLPNSREGVVGAARRGERKSGTHREQE